MTENAKPVAYVRKPSPDHFPMVKWLVPIDKLADLMNLYAAQPPQDERGQPVALTEAHIDSIEAALDVLDAFGEASDRDVSPEIWHKHKAEWRLAVARAALAASAPALQAAEPEELFEGHAVFKMLRPDAQRRTSAENVADVLDAVVRLMRYRANNPNQEQNEASHYDMDDPAYNKPADWSEFDAIAASAPALQGEHRVFRDGNQWCAVGPGFKNLQESPAGFGDTSAAALDALALDTPGNRNPESRYAGYKGDPLPDNATDDQKAAWQEGKRAASPDDAEPTLRSALNAMLTQFGMDEDEWSKPTFDQARRALAAPAPPVDTSPMYKALIEARLALLAVNSFASQVAIGLIDKVLNAAPDDASAPALQTWQGEQS